MKTFYTLGPTAGLIRNNKFLEKADVIAIATFRAEQRGMPIKIFEHIDSPANRTCILVANPDGSVEKPSGKFAQGNYSDPKAKASDRDAIVEPDHHQMVPNQDSAHLLLASAEEKKLTAIYLKSNVSEYAISQIEHELGVEMGLYDDRVLHCYTEDADKLKAIETKLSEASVEVDRVTHHVVKASAEEPIPVISSMRKAAMRARAAMLPELSARAAVRAGRNFRVYCHCELYDGGENKPPMIIVFGDGQRLGEAKSERDAARMMSSYADRAFSKFLRKHLDT
jgi:hypothetical protein